MNKHDFALLQRYHQSTEITNTELTTILPKELGRSVEQIAHSNAVLRDASFIEPMEYNDPQRRLKYKMTKTGAEKYQVEVVMNYAAIMPRENKLVKLWKWAISAIWNFILFLAAIGAILGGIWYAIDMYVRFTKKV